EENVYSVMDLIRADNKLVVADENLSSSAHQLRMELPSNVTKEDVTITETALYKSITISIAGVDNNYVYSYPLVGSSDHIADFTFDYAGGNGVFEIVTDAVYVLNVTFEGQYLYLDFADPHEVYDAIVVVDAGHGGKDGGCSNGDVLEKDINLAISEKLKSIFSDSEYNVGVYFTREKDFNPTYSSRVGLANDLNADLFLSIHINSTSSGRTSKINGTEVMYRSSDSSGLSKAFAQNCLDSMLSALGSNSKGLVAGDEIYIIRTSNVPVALAEVGFITNKEELEKMVSEEYQQTAAQSLYDAIINTLKENGKL
ncbi:MAG: N-acetylmuramoyl-L-alanine amidase, partial [Lachnospiraceae bacterium]|nr:N-acetylmuramoyl-L-alanine amidase [Lachnospiraceae bacterium]